MAYTLEQYNALCEAISTGAKFIKYADKETHFRTVAEMEQLKYKMEVGLGLRTRRSRKTVGVYDKGLCIGRNKPTGKYVPVALPVSQTRGDTFTIYIKDAPGSDTIELRNGIAISKEYASGNELNIPYLKSGGIYVILPLYVNNEVRQDISYAQGSGKIVKPSGNWEDDDYISIQIEYNG